jgi:EAL and modified HD-GYP domain-containing signal transduction protein
MGSDLVPVSTVLCPHSTTSTPQILVGRQPIYTQQREVFAYEVLLHRHESYQGEAMKKYQDTSQLIVNALVDIGLEAIVGQKRALINLTGGSLILDYALTLPPDQVVIGVVESMLLNDIPLEHVHDLSAYGYLIAVDHVMVRDYRDLLEDIANIITVDISALDPVTLEQHIAPLRRSEVALLAKNVMTPDDFAACKDLGFTYFQGDFLCQPDVVKGRRSPTNRLALLHLLAKLQDPEIEFSEVEELISHDVSLSYRVLRVVNSAFFGLPRQIDSLRQGLLLLGLRSIMRWVSMILLTGIDDKPHELLTTAMIRARMCEQLALAMEQDKQETFFLVGLFSVLDALVDTPMPEVLPTLPLADDVTQALLSYEGMLGTVLRCVLAYERGQWNDVTCPGLDSETILNAYMEAIFWASEVGSTLARG